MKIKPLNPTGMWKCYVRIDPWWIDKEASWDLMWVEGVCCGLGEHHKEVKIECDIERIITPKGPTYDIVRLHLWAEKLDALRQALKDIMSFWWRVEGGKLGEEIEEAIRVVLSDESGGILSWRSKSWAIDLSLKNE